MHRWVWESAGWCLCVPVHLRSNSLKPAVGLVPVHVVVVLTYLSVFSNLKTLISYCC